MNCTTNSEIFDTVILAFVLRILEIPILTVEIIYIADHSVKIGISNIIKSQTLTIFTLLK